MRTTWRPTSPSVLVSSVVGILLATLLLVSGCFGQDLAELEADHALSFDFPTPHTKWARPYALGKTRVLFFSDGRGTLPRECVELMQRFDLEAKAVFWTNLDDSPKTQWHGGELGERRMLDLLRQQWDCIVFLGEPPTRVPTPQRELILQAVRKGSGLVFAGAEDAIATVGKKSVTPALGNLDPEDAGGAYTLGSGRVIYLPQRPKIGYYEGWEVDYDYWQERLGRSLLWAAGKEPAVRLELSLIPRGTSAANAARNPAGEPAKLKVEVSGKFPGGSRRLKVSLRCPGRPPIILPEVDFTSVGAELSLPRLAEGQWHADVSLTGLRGIESWRTLSIPVKSGRPAPLVRLDGNWGEPGGVISGTVLLEGDPRPKDFLRVLILDRRRRILARQDFPAGSGSRKFSFPTSSWLPMLVTVEARLYTGGSEAARAYQYFHVTKRKQGRFNFLMWGAPQGTLAPYVEQTLAKNGVTLQLEWENPPLQVGAYDIGWVPFTTELSAEKTPEGITNPFCWNDGPAVRKQIDTLVNLHRRSRESGSFVYSIGDENKTLGSCLSPFCAEQYRVFLQQTYGSLEALNRSWGTRFPEWKAVGLSTPRDDDEVGSKKGGNYPRWFDRQAFKSWNYVQYCLKYSKAYRELDPKAKTGFDGGGGFATGDDLDLIVRSMGSWAPYRSLADEVIRSIAPRDFVRSNWIGGRDKSPGPLLQQYWRLVNLGADSVWWWMWNYLGQNLRGFLAPDLRLYPEIREMVEDTRIVREGLGDLLLASTMQDDRIAVLYSYPSVFASKLEKRSALGGYEEAHAGLVKFIRASGYQFRYLTDRMLRQGEADLSRYRILFLPRADALGEVEARAISKFVEGGGTVVADFRPGTFDDHCKTRAKGALDELFGIKVGKVGVKTVTLAGGEGLKTVSDTGINLSGARAGRRVDGAPLWLTRNVGKGRAILLNAQMASLPQLAPSGHSKESLWEFEPELKLSRVDGSQAKDAEVTRWRNGSIEIISVLSRGKKPEQVKLSFRNAKQVYDLRYGKSHAPGREVTATILPDRASFFILMDRSEALPLLQLERVSLNRGETVKAQLSVPEAQGMHAVKIRVSAGNRALPWQEQSVIVGAEPVALELPVAFNDPFGEYRITATDLFSGRDQVATVTVHN